MFPIITKENQKAFEEKCLEKGLLSEESDVPEICGYYGRACRQMNKSEGACKMLCTYCSLAEFCKEKSNENMD